MLASYQWVAIFLIASFRHGCEAVNPVTDEEYLRMPPVFHMDTFDDCLEITPKTLYCSVTIQLEPENADQPSEVWEIIEKTKPYKRYYRHDILRYSICVPRTCPNISSELYEVGIAGESLQVELSQCLSEKLKHFDLKGIVTDSHCENEERFYTIGTPEVVVALGLSVLLALVFFATCYEGLARYKPKKEYDEITKTPFGKVISCFSLPNNYYRLIKQNDDADTKDLKCLQGMRFFNMMCVILSHTMLATFGGPVENTKFVEEITQKPINIVFTNSFMIVQTFFAISGWLLSYHFFLMFEGMKEVKFWYILLAFLNRYIRLTPALLILIGINSTWLAFFFRAPIWDKLVGEEYRYCRDNGWSNLLYINNYYNKERQCMQHTWYVAADTQLFVISLIVVVFMWKYPQHVKKILITMISISIITPIVVNYWYDVDILLRVYPESMYSIFLDTPNFHIAHTSIHANFSGYMVGLTGGYLFYQYRGKNVFDKSRMYRLLWWLIVPGIPCLLVSSGHFLYSDNFQASRLISAIYSGFYRPIFALCICLGIFGFTQKVGWFALWLCEWNPIQILGRLTYSAFLVHTALIRMRSAQRRHPVYASYFTLIADNWSDLALSYIFAFLLCMLAEMPMSSLQRLMVPQLAEKRREGLTEKSMQRLGVSNGEVAVPKGEVAALKGEAATEKM